MNDKHRITESLQTYGNFSNFFIFVLLFARLTNTQILQPSYLIRSLNS